MPSPEAVGQARTEHMVERALEGACSAVGSVQTHLVWQSTPVVESVLRFPVRRRLADSQKMVVSFVFSVFVLVLQNVKRLRGDPHIVAEATLSHPPRARQHNSPRDKSERTARFLPSPLSPAFLSPARLGRRAFGWGVALVASLVCGIHGIVGIFGNLRVSRSSGKAHRLMGHTGKCCRCGSVASSNGQWAMDARERVPSRTWRTLREDSCR
jgi:hypothetical protein